MNYKQFIFDKYTFDAPSKTLTLNYSIDEALHFTETYVFGFDLVDYDPTVLDRALQILFFTAGVSYYKTFLPEHLVIRQGEADSARAHYLSETYQKGLGEFFYVNQLDPRRTIEFPIHSADIQPLQRAHNDGLLVGLGGGKDSLLAVELLKDTTLPLATWSLNHRTQLGPLVERVGLPHFWVERTWDSQLSTLNKEGAYNGHIPISAIFAAVGTVVAILTGYRDTIVSNEQSANEPTLEYQGVAVNHQYSKSQMFERSFQKLLRNNFADSIRYYSLLRPLSELRVAELFAKEGFDTYHGVFSSCNRAYTLSSPGLFWDGTCPKCAFVYLILAPFVDEERLNQLIGKNLLLDPSLDITYRQLLGIEGDKPLECVGEVKESRAAMRMMQAVYPDLARYTFDLPEDYDFRALSSHEIPPEIFALIAPKLS